MKISELIPNFNSIYEEDLKTEDHLSCFIQEEGYKILILRLIKISDSSLKYVSTSYLFYQNKVFLFDRETETLNEVKGGGMGLYRSLIPLYEQNNKIIDLYAEEVDKLEDCLYERNIPRFFMDVWFETKKDLSKIERYYQRTSDVLGVFLKKKELKLGESELRDLVSTIDMRLMFIRSKLSKMDNLHHYYSSVKNDRLNSNIYYMTLLSAVFLPLNLVVGFFGMNTEGLFFKDNPAGTHKVVLILAGTLVTALLGLRIIKIIDNYIFRHFLYKYDIYRKFSKKIDNLLN